MRLRRNPPHSCGGGSQLFTFGANGLIGIYLLSSWGIASSETGVVDAVIKSLGIAGVLLILVSQTRINTANYYLASSNLQVLADRAFGRATPRTVWVLVAGVLAHLFMLTDVLGYLLTALAWQGVLVTAWVAIALVHIALRERGAEDAATRMMGGGAVAWLLASAVGIAATVQSAYPVISQLAPLIAVVLAAGSYGLVRTSRLRGGPPRSDRGGLDTRNWPTDGEPQSV
ncbi:hypothetical protein [Prescottella agglutinans]|uniref:hypothetical protein n=1 Tax=Prescottella agglutinans TaxID=1644129 RepID=UPI003D96F3CF